MCMMMADTMDALGLSGKYVVKVNNRKYWDGALDALGVASADRLTVLRAIDKLDRLGLEGVTELLGPGRRDESGDYTKGAGLGAETITIVAELLERGQFVEKEDFSNVNMMFDREMFELSYGAGDKLAGNATYQQAVGELEQIQNLVSAAGYGLDKIKIDPSVVRGLEYYTGPVFEIELTFQVPNEKGQPVVFGAVGGGGRYDGLVSRFRSEPVPATGFSIGVSRLTNALKLTGLLDAEPQAGPVVVLVLDRDPAAIADYQKLTAELRQAGIRAEMYLGSSCMNAQMKYADRRHAAAAVIVGSNERAEGRVTIKDLEAGAQQAKGIGSREAYVAERPGQWTADRADLVAELSKIPAVARMRASG
jgi:histidyl-tRNA synthetase